MMKALSSAITVTPQFLLSITSPAGRARFASLWGLANPRSRSQGDRRDKRPAYVSPYVHRKEGCRRREAATLSLRGLG